MTFQQMLIKRNFNCNDCIQSYNGTLDIHTSTSISLVYATQRWFLTDILKFRLIIIIIVIIIIIMQTGFPGPPRTWTSPIVQNLNLFLSLNLTIWTFLHWNASGKMVCDRQLTQKDMQSNSWSKVKYLTSRAASWATQVASIFRLLPLFTLEGTIC